MAVLKAILSAFYAVGVFFRNLLYDTGLLKSVRHAVPVICVGNITVGGTGKTPTVEFLVAALSEKGLHPAVLSRGYGRRTKGYREVSGEDSFVNTGDEPMQIKMKFPTMPVVVCEDRNAAVDRIVREHPQTDVIIMDDGFQHRSICPEKSVVLIDYTRPIDKDHLLPWGSLRDERRQLRRADLFLVTKAPANLSAKDRERVSRSLHVGEGQNVFFSTMTYGKLRPIFFDEVIGEERNGRKAVLFSGIGNPDPFAQGASGRCQVVETVTFPDHHVYKVGEMKRLEKAMKLHGEDVLAVTTEKDAVKLAGSAKIGSWLRNRLYVLPMQLAFPDNDEEKFIDEIAHVVERD